MWQGIRWHTPTNQHSTHAASRHRSSPTAAAAGASSWCCWCSNRRRVCLFEPCPPLPHHRAQRRTPSRHHPTQRAHPPARARCHCYRASVPTAPKHPSRGSGSTTTHIPQNRTPHRTPTLLHTRESHTACDRNKPAPSGPPTRACCSQQREANAALHHTQHACWLAAGHTASKQVAPGTPLSLRLLRLLSCCPALQASPASPVLARRAGSDGRVLVV